MTTDHFSHDQWSLFINGSVYENTADICKCTGTVVVLEAVASADLEDHHSHTFHRIGQCLWKSARCVGICTFLTSGTGVGSAKKCSGNPILYKPRESGKTLIMFFSKSGVGLIIELVYVTCRLHYDSSFISPYLLHAFIKCSASGWTGPVGTVPFALVLRTRIPCCLIHLNGIGVQFAVM